MHSIRLSDECVGEGKAYAHTRFQMETVAVNLDYILSTSVWPLVLKLMRAYGLLVHVGGLGGWMLCPNPADISSQPTLQFPFLACVTVTILVSLPPLKHKIPNGRDRVCLVCCYSPITEPDAVLCMWYLLRE